MKVLLAVLIFVIGAYYQLYRHEQEELAASGGRGGRFSSEGSRTTSAGVSLAEQNEKINRLQADFAAEFDSEDEDVEDHDGYNAPLLY